jgi:hypothetical protein
MRGVRISSCAPMVWRSSRCGMGLDPEWVVSAVGKTMSYNDGRYMRQRQRPTWRSTNASPFIRPGCNIYPWIAASHNEDDPPRLAKMIRARV